MTSTKIVSIKQWTSCGTVLKWVKPPFQTSCMAKKTIVYLQVLTHFFFSNVNNLQLLPSPLHGLGAGQLPGQSMANAQHVGATIGQRTLLIQHQPGGGRRGERGSVLTVTAADWTGRRAASGRVTRGWVWGPDVHMSSPDEDTAHTAQSEEKVVRTWQAAALSPPQPARLRPPTAPWNCTYTRTQCQIFRLISI